MTSSNSSLQLDVAVFGGGVAGLWLLARLRDLGYAAALFEKQALGAGQTRYAQGIIHGGTKYALTGKLSGSSQAIAAMPAVWRACLEGRGELDLSSVPVLSPYQYLWSTTSLTSRMAGFFASRLMRSRTQALDAAHRPQVFRNPGFHGQIYRLDEPVLDTAGIVRALAEPHHEAILAAPEVHFDPQREGCFTVDDGTGATLAVQAKRLVLAAGKGNRDLLQALGHEAPAMQLRPLQMVMLRGALPEMLYAHCLGASANPRITITSHRDLDGGVVWYLGGQVAEAGVGMVPAALIATARGELQDLLPWVDFSHCQWASLPIDRAEPRQADGSRPDTPFVDASGAVLTTWPTKLAFAPQLAAQVLERLQQGGITPSGSGVVPPWPRPEYAQLPWQEEERWS